MASSHPVKPKIHIDAELVGKLATAVGDALRSANIKGIKASAAALEANIRWETS